MQIVWPSDAELDRAEKAGKRRVFACVSGPNRGRIAFSHIAAMKGVMDATVRSINKHSSLVANLVEAEKWLLKQRVVSSAVASPVKSVAQRLAEARKAAAQPDREVVDLCTDSEPETPSPEGGPSGSGSGAGMLGVHGMVRSKRTQLILRCFTQGKPISIQRSGCPDITDFDEEGDIQLPGSLSYRIDTNRTDSMPRYEDWHKEKTNSIKAWPLMTYSQLMPFFSQAIRLCKEQGSTTALASVEAFEELRNVTGRLYRHMELMSALGTEQRCFKVRIFLHLQCMTVTRVLHTGGEAMAVFRHATKLFMRRLFGDAESPAVTSSASKKSSTKKSTKKATKPRYTCYLCATAGHYCNNPKFHKRNSEGKYPAVSTEMRSKILAKIDTLELTDAAKKEKKATVKAFWKDRCLPIAS